MTRRTACLILLVAAGPALTQTPSDSSDTFTNIRRVVAMGDIHGDIERLVELLRTAGLIDAKKAWTGGDAHLVLDGDFLDRGDHSAQVLDLLMELEPQARKAGGRLHALIGNHEAMNLYGDLRYVTEEDFAGFASADGGDPREAHRRAFLPDGKYGRWLRRQNAIIRINDSLFLHAGISPKYADWTRRQINTKVRDELANFNKLPKGIVMDDQGPLWYRGLAELPEDDRVVAKMLPRVLAAHQVRHIVIGHSALVAVLPRFEGKVIAIDVGLSKPFDGPPAFLLFEDGKYFAVHRGQRLELPLEGGNVLEYLRSAAELEPANSRLRRALQPKRQ